MRWTPCKKFMLTIFSLITSCTFARQVRSLSLRGIPSKIRDVKFSVTAKHSLMALQNSQSECLNCWSFINNETKNVKINQWHKLISSKNWQFYSLLNQRWFKHSDCCSKILKIKIAECFRVAMINWNLYALVEIKLPWVWSRALHYRIALVWANISPSNTCSGSFTCTSNYVSEEKETRKCNFISYKIFLKQYFV